MFPENFAQSLSPVVLSGGMTTRNDIPAGSGISKPANTAPVVYEHAATAANKSKEHSHSKRHGDNGEGASADGGSERKSGNSHAHSPRHIKNSGVSAEVAEKSPHGLNVRARSGQNGVEAVRQSAELTRLQGSRPVSNHTAEHAGNDGVTNAVNAANAENAKKAVQKADGFVDGKGDVIPAREPEMSHEEREFNMFKLRNEIHRLESQIQRHADLIQKEYESKQNIHKNIEEYLINNDPSPISASGESAKLNQLKSELAREQQSKSADESRAQSESNRKNALTHTQNAPRVKYEADPMPAYSAAAVSENEQLAQQRRMELRDAVIYNGGGGKNAANTPEGISGTAEYTVPGTDTAYYPPEARSDSDLKYTENARKRERENAGENADLMARVHNAQRDADILRKTSMYDGRTKADDEIKAEKNKENCETCESRQYKDGSNDGSVSFQNATAVDPSQAKFKVMAHEQEHVRNEQIRAKSDGRKVIAQSVRIMTANCPDCGQIYVSGGLTTTVTKKRAENAFANMSIIKHRTPQSA